MIIYDYRCAEGHRFEAAVKSMSSGTPDCACGASSQRVPTSVNVGGRADPGPTREQMPKSWRAIDGGHPGAVAHWREKIQKREKLEESYPELAGDRRPVLAHEGVFHGRPLRAGDDPKDVLKKQRNTG